MPDSERQRFLDIIAGQGETIKQLTTTIEQLRTELGAQAERYEAQQRELNAKLDIALKQLHGKKRERSKPTKMPPPPKAGDRSTPEQAAERRAENRELVKQHAVDQGEVIHAVTEDQQTCTRCGHDADFRPVGDGKASDLFDYVPGYFRRSRHVVERMACTCGKTIVSAEGPVRSSPGSKYGPGLVAWVVGQKCIMSMPVHRIAKMLKGHGIPVARSSLNDLLLRAALRLEPIYNLLRSQVRQGEIVQADETPIKLLSHNKKAYVWVFVSNGTVVFHFAVDRSADTPKTLLGDSKGKLVIDDFSGYKPVLGESARLEVACLAHIRRKFYESLSTAPEAQQALDFIREVYVAEAEAVAAGIAGSEQHLTLRQMRAGPAMGKLKKWIIQTAKVTPPRSRLGKALAHAKKRWKAATRFLYDAKLPVDNNLSERLIRIVAIGRKNFGGAGSKDGGKALAILYSLVATCEAQGLNPFAYLRDVIELIGTTPPEQLTPQAWAAARG